MATSQTSITEKAARAVAASKASQPIVTCDRITGLRLKGLKAAGVAAWQYRYKDATGKRRVFSLGKFPAIGPAKAASLALAFQQSGNDPFQERASKQRQQRHEARQAAERTVSAYLEGPYSRYQRRKKSGRETMRNICCSFPELLDRDMAGLSKADIEAWQDRREAEGRAFSTLKRAYGALQTMLNHATRQDPPIIESNPLARVRLERPLENDRARALSAKRKDERRLLTDNEKAGLFTGLDAFNELNRTERRKSRDYVKAYKDGFDNVAYAHWFVPFTYLGFYTGLRPGDMYSLTWRELNIPFGRLVKTPEKTKHNPEPAQIRMDLSGTLHDVMRAWWNQCGQPKTGLVFQSERADGPNVKMDKQAHRKAWVKVKELGGLPDSLVFYSLRHNFISTLVANPAWSLHDVAKLAGHKTVAMIEAHYGHLSPRAQASAISALEQSLPASGNVQKESKGLQ